MTHSCPTRRSSDLPAIRTAVKGQPNNMDYVSFLANTRYADAAAQAAVQNFDAVISLYQEALPQWRKIVAAKPADATSRNILAGMLVPLGNKSLSGQDTATANAYYKEATELDRKSATAAPTDAVSTKPLLSAVIGLSQTREDQAVRDEDVAIGK